MKRYALRWLLVLSIVLSQVNMAALAAEESNVNEAYVDGVICVVNSYTVNKAGPYGTFECYYAQGVNTRGEEVNILIGVQGCTSGETAVVTSLEPGFYTFELSADIVQAEKDIMVGVPVDTYETYDSDKDAFYGATVPAGTEITPEISYVVTRDGEQAKITENTRYIAVAPVGVTVDALDCRLFESGVTYTLAEEARVILGHDDTAGLVTETVFLMTAPANITPSIVYNISVEAATGGTVSVDKTTAARGECVTITVEAEAGYRFQTVLVDGETIGDYVFQFEVVGNHTVTAVFAEVQPATIDDAIYVVNSYTVNKAGPYGTFECYYAQGVNTRGEEVNILIGVQGCASGETAVVTSLEPGFYTFELSADIVQAEKDIMVGVPVDTYETYDSDKDAFYGATVPAGTEITPEISYVVTRDGEQAKITENTRYIAVAPVGVAVDALDCRVFENGVACDLTEPAKLLLSKDADGNAAVKTMIIFAEPDAIAATYRITATAEGEGIVSVSRYTGKTGDVVTVIATPKDGYKLKEILIDGVAIQENKFTIVGDHEVVAVFEKKTKSLWGHFALEVVATIKQNGQTVEICRWVWTPITE